MAIPMCAKIYKKLSERVEASLIVHTREACALNLIGMYKHLVVDEYDHY